MLGDDERRVAAIKLLAKMTALAVGTVRGRFVSRRRSAMQLTEHGPRAISLGKHTKASEMTDRRQHILDTALSVLREQGLAGFTQPRIAQRSGLRQSHLTYYYPTRLDLLAATAEVATDALLAELARTLDGRSLQSVAASIARLALRPDNTRVMMALAESADTEPSIKAIFSSYMHLKSSEFEPKAPIFPSIFWLSDFFETQESAVKFLCSQFGTLRNCNLSMIDS